jgi:hypothetical protein
MQINANKIDGQDMKDYSEKTVEEMYRMLTNVSGNQGIM